MHTADLSGNSWSTTFHETSTIIAPFFQLFFFDFCLGLVPCNQCYDTIYFVSAEFFSGKFYLPSNFVGLMFIGDGVLLIITIPITLYRSDFTRSYWSGRFCRAKMGRRNDTMLCGLDDEGKRRALHQLRTWSRNLHPRLNCMREVDDVDNWRWLNRWCLQDGVTWKNVTGVSCALSSVTYSPSLAQYIATVGMPSYYHPSTVIIVNYQNTTNYHHRSHQIFWWKWKGSYTATSKDGMKWSVSSSPIKDTISYISSASVAHGNQRTLVLASISEAQNNLFLKTEWNHKPIFVVVILTFKIWLMNSWHSPFLPANFCEDLVTWLPASKLVL